MNLKMLFCPVRVGKDARDGGGDGIAPEGRLPVQRRPGISAAEPEVRLRPGSHPGGRVALAL